MNNEDGILQGPTPADDLPLKICSHDVEGYHCVILKIEEFYQLKGDKEKCDIRVQSLERNCGL